MPRQSVRLSLVLLSWIGLPAVEARAQGSAVVRVIVQSPTAPASFDFTGTPSGSVPAGGSLAASSLSPGSYTSTQAGAGTATLVAIACDDAGSSTPSVGNVATRSATFNVESGETVTCTFTYGTPERQERSDPSDAGTGDNATGGGTNPFTDPDADFEDFPDPDDLPALAGTFAVPKAGPWDVFNHQGRMACTGFAAPLAEARDRGTIEVRDGGRTLYGVGMSEGTAPLTMHAVPAITGRYTGSVGGSQDGIPMTIEFFWQLVTDEWIIGYLTSTVTASGMTCNMFRTYELEYAGE